MNKLKMKSNLTSYLNNKIFNQILFKMNNSNKKNSNNNSIRKCSNNNNINNNYNNNNNNNNNKWRLILTYHLQIL